MRKLLRSVANYDPDYYDMYADANESFFAGLYLQLLKAQLSQAGIAPPAKILDVGCQAGRLSIPLAKEGFSVTGLDKSGFALKRAEQHARKAGMRIDWRQADLVEALNHPWRESFDAILCIEVLYQIPQYRRIMSHLKTGLRAGGLLFVSHRPRSYYLFEAMRQQDFKTALGLFERDEGPVDIPEQKNDYANWHTVDQLRVLYESLGLKWLAWHPIDRFAWLRGTDFSQLTQEQKNQWVELEMRLPAEEAPCCRYVLVVAQAT